MLSSPRKLETAAQLSAAEPEVATSNAPSPRTGASLVSLGTKTRNLFLVFGGASVEEGLSNELYVLEADAASAVAVWDKIQPITSPDHPTPPPRYDHAAVAMEADGVLICGGAGPDGVCLDDLWSFDMETREWTQLSPAGFGPSPRVMRGAMCLHPSDPRNVIVWGGGADGAHAVSDAAVYVLDLDTSTWTRHPPITGDGAHHPEVRLGHALVPVDDASVLMFGGMDDAKVYDDAWILSMVTWQWTRVGQSAAFAVAGHAATAVRADRLEQTSTGSDSTASAVVWTGGLTSSHAISSAWHCVSAATEWVPRPLLRLPQPVAAAMPTKGKKKPQPQQQQAAGHEEWMRLDHCVFAMEDADTEETGVVLGVFGGMNHSSVFHDVHVARVSAAAIVL
ncbi:hypothetical protein BC828DRAFT_389328 [Blastocladiella britannica]|nr:hypothetical protein BC828DRAFT_389328 [Blastocladiella britannica]